MNQTEIPDEYLVCGNNIVRNADYFGCLDGYKFGYEGIFFIKFMSNVNRLYFENFYIDQSFVDLLFFYIKKPELIKSIVIVNAFVDKIPFDKFVNLSSVVIENSPVLNIEKICNLKHVEEVFFSNTKIVDIRPLRELKKLSYIHFSDNEIFDITPLIGMDIKSLMLQEKNLKNIEPISYINGLKNLRIFDMDIYSLESLRLNRTIENFYISNLPLKDLSPLENWEQLKSLSIEKISIDLRPLKKLKGINRLELLDMKIDDLTFLLTLEKIKTLDLSQSAIHDLSPLYTLTWLEEIHLTNATYPPGQLAELKAALPHTNIITQ